MTGSVGNKYSWFFLVAAVITCAMTILSSPAQAEQSQGIAGTWAVRFGQRVFLVLEIRDPSILGAAPTGTLSRPEQATFLGGRIVQNVQEPIVTLPINVLKHDEKLVDFTIYFRGETAGFTFKQVGTDEARLQVNGAPLDPFPAVRVPRGTAVSEDWQPDATYELTEAVESSSPEMEAIYRADQLARGIDVDGDEGGRSSGSGDIISEDAARREIREDALRRDQARALLKAGKLRTGEDFERAAFVLQHGTTSQDYLLAHHLAILALGKGNLRARWIAAATLDRYLHSIGQPQIYGTQFKFPATQGLEQVVVTQEPFDRSLVGDEERRDLMVPVLATQLEQQRNEQQRLTESRRASSKGSGDR